VPIGAPLGYLLTHCTHGKCIIAAEGRVIRGTPVAFFVFVLHRLPPLQGGGGRRALGKQLGWPDRRIAPPFQHYASKLTETPTDRFRIGYGRADLKEGLAAIEADFLHETRSK
jgi:hypothetical protein